MKISKLLQLTKDVISAYESPSGHREMLWSMEVLSKSIKEHEQLELEIIRLINSHDDNPDIQNAIDEQVERKMNEFGLAVEDEQRYWDFYQKVDNLIYSSDGNEIIGFKEIERW